MKMISLLLLILSSCLCAATFVVNVTQSSYEAEENHSITLEWTFTTRTQGSYRELFIYCEANTDHGVLVLYQVHEGVEIPESQDDQFSGRVQSDKDVLREGRIRLHVSRLRTEDSGLYLCDVKTEDGFNSGRCRLNVTGKTEEFSKTFWSIALIIILSSRNVGVALNYKNRKLDLSLRQFQLQLKASHNTGSKGKSWRSGLNVVMAPPTVK
ncbi:uncharacterized protein LOC106942638 [Poecilia latipinna]|uniref:uncharacterized protein LOC106942638 n=1 Tax=Poecilia latipinna TaxID=48699 RepID=UPI00072DEF4B|nr:PREDICTED: uncharacterized protein LOC106942638 [Poecilia latipinna]